VNFLNCFGAGDTKHVKIIPPEVSQLFYYRFQEFGADIWYLLRM